MKFQVIMPPKRENPIATKEGLLYEIELAVDDCMREARNATRAGDCIAAMIWAAKVPHLRALEARALQCAYETGDVVVECAGTLAMVMQRIDYDGQLPALARTAFDLSWPPAKCVARERHWIPEKLEARRREYCPICGNAFTPTDIFKFEAGAARGVAVCSQFCTENAVDSRDLMRGSVADIARALIADLVGSNFAHGDARAARQLVRKRYFGAYDCSSELVEFIDRSVLDHMPAGATLGNVLEAVELYLNGPRIA